MLIGLIRVACWYAGAAAGVYGVSQVHEPSAWIVAGVVLMAEALPMGKRNAPESD